MLARLTFACALVGLGLFACADPPRPAAAKKPATVARHLMVIVTEDDGTNSPTARRDSIVLAEPLERVPAKEAAFAFRNAGYKVGLGWDRAHDSCLDIAVEREGDFRMSGCVPIGEPTARVASYERPNGASIEVSAWFFDADAPLPSAPRTN